jgi:hypothetical protein
MQRVLCFGGRDYIDSTFIKRSIDQLTKTIGPFVCIAGGARGVDTICVDYCLSLGFPTLIMPAPWDAFKRAAGPIRNQWMLDHATPTYALGFPGGVGTADMMRKIQKAGIPLWQPASIL